MNTNNIPTTGRYNTVECEGKGGVFGEQCLEMLIVARSQHTTNSKLFSLARSAALTDKSLGFNPYWY